MSKSADRRILGLSPRARRVVIPVLAITAVLVALAYFSNDGSGEPSRAGPVVGGALSAVDGSELRIFEAGQGGPGHRADAGRWTHLDSSAVSSVIGSASAGSSLQPGGHVRGPRR